MKTWWPALIAGVVACTEAVPPQTPSPARDVDRYHVDVRAPANLRYATSLLGTGPTPMTVVVANRGPEPLDVANLALRFEAKGEGIQIQCAADADARSSEPSTVLPGKNQAFERAIDCRLPLAGHYQVSVSVAFGPDRSWRPVRTYSLDVIAPAGLEPHALNDSGLVATIGAAPIHGNAEGRGHPRVALALTNTGGVPLELPTLRVETRARRRQTPWSCTSSPTSLATPNALAAGATYREPFDVACLGLDVKGAYDVEIVLLVGDGRAVSLGHLQIEVGDDPARVLPAP